MNKVKITQVKSQIGRLRKQKATLCSLGLRKIGQSSVHNLTPQVEGMINKIFFLIKVDKLI